MPIISPHSELSHFENDPCFDKLLMRWPANGWHSPAYSTKEGQSIVSFTDSGVGLPDPVAGADQSRRQVLAPRSQMATVNWVPPGYSGCTMMCWVKVYTFPNTGNDYYYNTTMLMWTHALGYIRAFGYDTDHSYSAYGYPRRVRVWPLHVDALLYADYYLSPEEWTHIAWSFPAYSTTGTQYPYINGKPAGAVVDDRSNYPFDGAYIACGNYDLGNWSGGDNETKDYRAYFGVLTPAEVEAVYEHSLEYHQSTMGLGIPDKLYVPTERCPANITLTRDYHVRI